VKPAMLLDMEETPGREPTANGDIEPNGWEYSVEDYFRIQEEDPLHKYEFDDGQIRLMAGGILEHARLQMAVALQLGPQLEGKRCAIFSSDGRVRTGNLITYPDLTITCGRLQRDAEDPHSQLAPCVLIEVTSKSSVRYDRGKKRLRYFEIPSLREYVIVSHLTPLIDVYSRTADGAWTGPVSYSSGARALIPSLSLEIDINALYESPLAEDRD
jgi:Uma2 family endonuclease